MNYRFQQGDIVDLNLNPTIGHEQSGTRPALIIWNNRMIQRTGGHMALVCPITSTDNGFPLHIKLDEVSKKTKGFVECEQCKVVEIYDRKGKYRDRVSQEVLNKVVKIIQLSIETTK